MNLDELIQTGAEKLGLSLTNDQIGSFILYLAELNKWNQKINLTAIREDRDSAIKHVLDSLSYLKGFSCLPGMRLLDIGSGAGFPALPIKIACPGVAVVLVESIKKKATFLRHIVRTLGIPLVEVMDKRVEELPDSLHCSFDIVTARAYANMNTALLSARPFLKPAGLVVLSRGPEEAISDQELAEMRFILEKRTDLTLPFSDHRRALWVFRKLE